MNAELQEQTTISSTLTREAWLEERKKAIGASEVAAVLGVSPHKSAASLFWEKTGMVEPDNLDGLEWIEWGNELQIPIGRVFGKRTGRKVTPEPENTIRRSSVYPWLAASLDFEQEADGWPGPGALEIKNSDAFMRKAWLQGPPIYYQVQLQAQMCVCGLHWGTIAVLLGGNKLMHWDFERNEPFIEAMLRRTREFWNCVETGIPPSIDGTEHTARALAKLFPDDNGTAVRLGESHAALFSKREKIRRLQKVLDAKRSEVENELRAAIGDSTYAVFPNGAVLDTKRIDVAERTQTVAAYSYRRMIVRTKALPLTIPFVEPGQSQQPLLAIATVGECEEATEAISAVAQTFKKHNRLSTYKHHKRRLLKQNPHCYWCNRILTRHTATIEHVVPLAAGGDNSRENLALACFPCNQEHGDGLSAPSKN